VFLPFFKHRRLWTSLIPGPKGKQADDGFFDLGSVPSAVISEQKKRPKSRAYVGTRSGA